MNRTIKLGTRGSQLALWQTEWVAEQLKQLFPKISFEIQTLKTKGDKILDVPLAKIGDKGLFTKELDRALLNEEIDMAVHSLKDVPTAIPEGLIIAAVTQRWDARDALISRSGKFADLPDGAKVATGSLRRKAQLLHVRPDLKMVDLRGNLNTRFRKFDESDWDAMILAVAGIERLRWQERITEKIDFSLILPAVGQGSFAIICREEDWEMRELLIPINHPASATAANAERALLRTLEGGCQIPIGAYAHIVDGKLLLDACIASLDGKKLIRDQLSGNPEDSREIGVALAHRLLENGGMEILQEIIRGTEK